MAKRLPALHLPPVPRNRLQLAVIVDNSHKPVPIRDIPIGRPGAILAQAMGTTASIIFDFHFYLIVAQVSNY